MKTLNCSFCGKSNREVKKLAAGPGGLHICDECVEACRLFMDGADVPSDAFDPHTWPTERLLGALAGLDATAETYRQHLAILAQLTSRSRSASTAFARCWR